MSGLVLLGATWNCWISYRNKYAGLLVLHVPLLNHWLIIKSLFCRYYFGRCLSELTQLVPLPYSQGRFTCYSDRLHKFSLSIPRCQQFFPRTDRLWNSLPIECFPLSYDLSDFKAWINRHLLTLGPF